MQTVDKIQNVGRSFIAQDETAYIQFLIQPCNGTFKHPNSVDLEDGETLSETLYMCQQKNMHRYAQKKRKKESPKNISWSIRQARKTETDTASYGFFRALPLPSGIFV
jgi:hypothetical protein